MKPEPPQHADGAVVLWSADLSGLNPSGACRHSRNGVEQTGFIGLLIASYDDDDGCYLFYCDGTWRVESDTYHCSIDDAKSQAAFEYPGIEKRWRRFGHTGNA